MSRLLGAPGLLSWKIDVHKTRRSARTAALEEKKPSATGCKRDGNGEIGIVGSGDGGGERERNRGTCEPKGSRGTNTVPNLERWPFCILATN
jgi:hypothetical protein